jgi:hypothetical protein
MEPQPFDLQARAALAVHSLTRLLDPQRGGLMYFLASWQARPPRAVHGLWDCGDGSGRHTDALTLARRMLPAGSPYAQPDPGEVQLEAWMMRFLGPKGLSWLPTEPWARPWGAEFLLHDWQPGEALAEISWAQRGTLLGLTSRFMASGDERYLRTGQALVRGLLEIAEPHPDGLFFPEGYYRAGGWSTHRPGLCPGLEEVNAAVSLPAVRFYCATGDERALELADGLVRYALKHTDGYHPDGRLRGAARGALLDHFHTRSNYILAALELGIVAGRRELVAWAKQSYDRAKTWGTEFGWFPEGLGSRHGEICCTADMIEIALQLGWHVDPAYAGDAERFGRNHLLESQYLSAECLCAAVEKLPAEAGPGEDVLNFSTTEGVALSQVGGFAARSTLNDAFHLDATAMMQCCNAAGTRGLYDLWRYAVHEEAAVKDRPPRLTLQLRFSVETPALRVISYEPSEGRLDILPKQDARLAIRLPPGANWAAVVTQPGAEMRAIDACRGTISLDVRADRPLEVRYPLVERAAAYRVGTPERFLECTGYWRGETLMRLDPPGSFCPLYARRDDLLPVQPARPAGPLIHSLAIPRGSERR